MKTLQFRVTRFNHTAKVGVNDVSWRDILEYITIHLKQFQGFVVYVKSDISGGDYVHQRQFPPLEKGIGIVDSIELDGQDVVFNIKTNNTPAARRLIEVYNLLKNTRYLSNVLCFGYGISQVDNKCKIVIGPYISYTYVEQLLTS